MGDFCGCNKQMTQTDDIEILAIVDELYSRLF